MGLYYPRGVKGQGQFSSFSAMLFFNYLDIKKWLGVVGEQRKSG